MQFLIALFYGSIGAVTWWCVHRSWTKFKRDGHLRLVGRGLDADLRNPWAVRSYVGSCGCVALICTIAAVALLVDLVV